MSPEDLPGTTAGSAVSVGITGNIIVCREPLV